MDSGVRHGTDIVKALSLGADMVFLGRPIIWGLAVAGQDGVEKVLGIIKHELSNAMMMCGIPTIAGLNSDIIWRQCQCQK